jgi:allantoin racemase
MTNTMVRQAAAVASQGTEIIGLTPFFGPESVEGNFESYLSAVGVMDRVLAYDGPYDAVVQGGFGEHGREGLQELLEVPVVDITEASAHIAMTLGRTFSVVTTLDRSIPQIEDRLRIGGLLDRCASIRASGIPVLDLERDTARAVDAVIEQVRIAVRSDRAEVICLGCGGMAGLQEKVQGQTSVPVVDAVAAGVALAEALVRLGLKTSKVRNYASPRPKIHLGWPLPAGG